MAQLKHNEIEISEDDPFRNDKLKRLPYAEVLTDIVSNYADGFVMAINNEWGTGKTTFVKMWQQHLKNEGFKTLYFNAWENDFENDVLVALLAELKILEKNPGKKTFQKVAKSAAPLMKKLLPSIFKNLLSKHTDEEFSKALKEILEGTAEVGAAGLVAEMESYSKRKDSIQSFRKNLQEFLQKAGTDKPVVFILDELDRCRPNYSVEVLEQIKHLFSVPGIVFVMAIDKVQLGHAIRGVYGSEQLNADEYLRRFIDLEYSIPEPNTKEWCDYLFEYFQLKDFFHLPNRLKHRPFINNLEAFQKASVRLFRDAKFSLRQQEKIFSHLIVTLRSFEASQYVLPHIVLILIYLKHYKSEKYHNIRSKKYSVQELVSEIEGIFPEKPTVAERKAFLMIESYMAGLYNNYLDREHSIELIIIDEKGSTMNIKSKFDTSEENREFKRFLEYYNRDWDLEGTSISFLLERIDLTERFKQQE